MSQTIEGALKIAAARTHVSAEEYKALLAGGFKWCSKGKHWAKLELFGLDCTRSDSYASSCRQCVNLFGRKRYVKKGRNNKKGARYAAARDGDKLQARRRVNHLVKAGMLPNPNDVACVDCKHIGPDRRHEYDHSRGYAAGNHEAVDVRCTRCHRLSDVRRGAGNVRLIRFRGKTLHLAAWARLIGISHRTLGERLEKWPLTKALTTPKIHK